ncbi:MAG: 4Fe-4S binding protein [Deltaproteobacteria bacterium]
MAAGAAYAPVLWKRSIAQPGFLAGLDEFSVYGIFRCLFAVPNVSCGNCPVLLCPGRDYWLPVWIGLPVSGIALGRPFCGWACPGGLVQDILSTFSLLRGKVQGSLAKVLSFGKYPMIAVSLVFLFLSGNPRRSSESSFLILGDQTDECLRSKNREPFDGGSSWHVEMGPLHNRIRLARTVSSS